MVIVAYVTQDEALGFAEGIGKKLSIFQSKIILAIRKHFGDEIRLSHREPSGIWDLDIAIFFIKTRESIDVRIEKENITIEGGNSRLRKEIKKIVETSVGGNNLEPLKEVICGAIYRHFKGGEYEVLSISMYTEMVDTYLVNYRSVNKGEDSQIIYSRPMEMFMDGRFQLKHSPK